MPVSLSPLGFIPLLHVQAVKSDQSPKAITSSLKRQNSYICFISKSSTAGINSFIQSWKHSKKFLSDGLEKIRFNPQNMSLVEVFSKTMRSNDNDNTKSLGPKIIDPVNKILPKHQGQQQQQQLTLVPAAKNSATVRSPTPAASVLRRSTSFFDLVFPAKKEAPKEQHQVPVVIIASPGETTVAASRENNFRRQLRVRIRKLWKKASWNKLSDFFSSMWTDQEPQSQSPDDHEPVEVGLYSTKFCLTKAVSLAQQSFDAYSTPVAAEAKQELDSKSDKDTQKSQKNEKKRMNPVVYFFPQTSSQADKMVLEFTSCNPSKKMLKSLSQGSLDTKSSKSLFHSEYTDVQKTTTVSSGRIDTPKKEDHQVNWRFLASMLEEKCNDATQCSALSSCPIDNASIQLLCHIDHEPTDTQVNISKNERTREIIVAFRGSCSFNDALHDAMFFQTSVQLAGYKVKIHTGFWKQYLSVREEIRRVIIEALSKEDTESSWTLSFCGHSLGGALAEIAATEFAAMGFDGTAKSISSDRPVSIVSSSQSSKISCYTFGTPRVGDMNFADVHDAHVADSFRIVNTEDIVPRLPGCIMDYYHAGRTVLLNEDGSLWVQGQNHGDCPLGPLIRGWKKKFRAEIEFWKSITSLQGFQAHLDVAYFNGLKLALTRLEV